MDGYFIFVLITTRLFVWACLAQHKFKYVSLDPTNMVSKVEIIDIRCNLNYDFFFLFAFFVIWFASHNFAI